ncbi:two-component system, NtrC family, C4-dicarboxylate transport response regulator DctD [Devosia crocina]|uniref:Two-component system, NtrC family, C4-dicarboxylate transport response regulator DctD n=1 Tax=Devosia crocina TaxID=429728 RepID=A0A1I7MZD2_9HYPH|nr:sigma-54 dependent transcriptional regulator [Devosia crocina]SFV27787.1 two-component system, NtrC family, C4-dicarboxylate transport response regulator DctD [Devosia crocina]
MTRGKIVFIDDEPDLCAAAADWLEASGFSIEVFTDPLEALQTIDAAKTECVVSDMRMPRLSGLDLLSRLQHRDPELPVVLLTGHGDVPLAVEAMQAGAYHFLEKPYDAEQLVSLLDNAVERRRLKREIERLRDEPADLEARLIGTSPAIGQIRRSVQHLAEIDVDVLITGETGTGKEVVARALHDFGRRRSAPFVAINCAAIPEAIFESEFFGHERGAFTGAASSRQGRIAFAAGGTVFLDEIESMPLGLQAKLLRVIQERVVEPVGANRQIPVDVRFIAATKVDLRAESEAGRFRSDLYFRLATIDLPLPPLRERVEDIPLLFAVFARRAAERHGLPLRELSAQMSFELQHQHWPGNVRELKSLAERTVIGFGVSALAPLARQSLPDLVAQFEAGMIAQALEQTDGATADAADLLGVPRRTLNEKIARYGLRGDRSPGEFPPG